jgi:hypothetical protein
MCTGRLEQAAQLAGRHPDTQVVIDHLGLPQPQEPPAPPEPFADLPKLLALATYASPHLYTEMILQAAVEIFLTRADGSTMYLSFA